jgi:hypothetical protein
MQETPISQKYLTKKHRTLLMKATEYIPSMTVNPSEKRLVDSWQINGNTYLLMPTGHVRAPRKVGWFVCDGTE